MQGKKCNFLLNLIVILLCLCVLLSNIIWVISVKEPLFTDNYHDNRQYKVLLYDKNGHWCQTLGCVEYVDMYEDYILVYDTIDKKLRKINSNSYFIKRL